MDNKDPLWSIQVAIYQALTSDTDLMADVTDVLDYVPRQTKFPYVSIGELTVSPRGAHDRFGARTTITLHGWSTYHGKRQVATIGDHLLRILDHQPLDIDGHHAVYVHHEQTVTQTERDNDIRHISCRFAVETEIVA